MKKNLVKATLICGVTLAALSAPISSVLAAPNDDKVAEQDAKLDKIKSKEKDAASELAKIKVDIEDTEKQSKDLLAKKGKTEQEVKDLDSDVVKLNKKIQKRDKQLQEQARTVQVNGNSSNYMAFVLNADSLSDAINRASTVSQLVGANRSIVREQQIDKEAVQTKKAVAQKKLAEQNKISAILEKNKGELEAKKAKQESLVADIAAEKATSEQDKQKFLDQKKVADTTLKNTENALAGGNASAANVSTNGGSSVPVNVNPNANGSAIVAEAQKHIGKPYQWGGKGPNAFDCSGFTSYVYRQVTGKEIGGFTGAQESAGTRIPVSAAQPGDLLFWGPSGGSYHVAISTGGGGYIHASTEGVPVGYGSVGSYTPDFAVRVQ